MNIPTIKTTAPFPYCTEYAHSPVAISPSYDRGVETRSGEVSFEFACFLIRVGELNRDDYVAMVMENSDEVEQRLKRDFGLDADWGDLSYKMYTLVYKLQLEQKINAQLASDNSGWADWARS